ncbi:M-phase phosphoprotein 9-like [Pseudonaja textilis]|uniref:M-phase phosphoprotein 9-like n=1 Tax=Pseudonaja textilis TaxID=8673 RepID=UPI000EAA764C|nr:M-phase phosphoprotein 9-like [Pseudonaja textilis]XP_026579654.1 M-phase phosphoprotein 9-like [Pseudonaja textilis]
MENLGLVKPEQGAPSADPDAKNAHNLVEYNISDSRSSPLFQPDVVSNFSGKVGPSAVTEEVRLLASSMQDAQSNRDPRILKKCETRWLHLFSLVERQCQEQIVAQQKVFCHQIHHIQNEIRRLGKLQTQNPCLCAKQASSVRLSDGCPLLGSPMGLKAEAFEENELFTSQFHPGHADHRAEASTMHQEGLTNSVSISSGYGTLSTVDLSPSKCDDLPSCMENSETMTKRPNHPAPAPEDVVVASVQDKRECSQTTIGHLPPLKENDGHVPTRFERQVHEGQPEEPNGKPLTSWAQKMKQNHLKKINVEEKMELEKEQTTDSTDTITAAAPSTTPFYLNQQNGSQNSLVSLSSGLTYWKLDEKEMYQALPKNLGNEFSTFSTKDCSEQLSSSDELKLTSLKDIYHKKQKEDKQLEEWNFSPVHSTHPPEILTLDPTLHMKPSELNAGRPLPGFYPSPEGPPFSPDSMAGPAFSLPSEANTFSHTTSTVVSPRSTESPRYASRPAALHRDPWGGCEFQNATSVPSSPHRNREILDMEDDNDNLTLTPSSDNQYPIPLANNCLAQHELSVACVEDPQVLSRIRQNLREKHIRHITDLRAYYESEILSLKQQLEASHTAPSEEMKKIHQNLTDRCNQLETSLHEANGRVRSLENKNKALEMEVADWRERFSALSATTKSLQERLEETRMNGKEKDNTISRLKRRLRDLEEAFEKAYKLSDNKDARLKEENRMFQNLLGEYESLGKEHERVKDSLNITENKLLDAHTQISDLKRTVSKLETQVKQLEHENSLKFRSLAEGHFAPSYASKLESFDVSRRKWLIPGSEFSIFTGQPLAAQDNSTDNRLEKRFTSPKQHSPPETSPSGLLTNEAIQKEIKTQEVPILKAFKEFEERKALKNRGMQAEKEESAAAETSKTAVRCPVVGFAEVSLGASRSPEKSKEQPRHKKFNSSSTQRSSSLPPSNRKTNTPTKRETMLTPMAVTYSPKRSPKENLSPGFSHYLSRNEDTMTRFDIHLNEVAAAPAVQYGSPRKRLQFCSGGDPQGRQPSRLESRRGSKSSSYPQPLHSRPSRDSSREGYEEGRSTNTSETSSSSAAAAPPYEPEFKYVSRIKTLAETERLFDELTQEKQEIESQLSRIPCARGRMTLQARLNQEALEDRLERINRELGSIRMTLKRFQVLRTSTNI